MRFIKNKNLWKNFIVAIVMIVIIVWFVCYSNYLHNQLEKAITEKESIKTQMDNIVIDLRSVKNELDTVNEELNSTNEELHAAYEKIESQSEEIERYKVKIADEEAKWQKRYEEYPIATEAWIAMKAQGWSDTVCAGIMGNLMAETGGAGSLHLDWDSNGSNGYGLVQWIGDRRSTIINRCGTYPSIKEQVQFIHDELYGANGVHRQVTESQLNAIMNAETPEECAYAFACYYERCAESVRYMRKGFARKAYEYFVN